jgi:hypothetical protein
VRGQEQTFPNWHCLSEDRHPAFSRKSRAKLGKQARPASAERTEPPGHSFATFAFVLAYSQHPEIRISARFMKTNGLKTSNRHTVAFSLDAFSVSSVLSLCLPSPTSPSLPSILRSSQFAPLLSFPRHNSRTGMSFTTSPRFTFATIGTTIVPGVVPEESRVTGSLRPCRRHNPSHDYSSLAHAICAFRRDAASSWMRRTARVRLCGTRGGAE